MTQTLLLADDSVTIQRVIELTFADEDIRVVAVGDGQQAIDRIKADPPDIVLADTGMPKHDGYEVAEFIRNDPALVHIPILLLTGACEPVDEARVREAGCAGVLVKPFEPQFVICRVRDLLGGRGVADPTALTPVRGSVQDRFASSVGVDQDDPIGEYLDLMDEAFDRLEAGEPARSNRRVGVDEPSRTAVTTEPGMDSLEGASSALVGALENLTLDDHAVDTDETDTASWASFGSTVLELDPVKVEWMPATPTPLVIHPKGLAEGPPPVTRFVTEAAVTPVFEPREPAPTSPPSLMAPAPQSPLLVDTCVLLLAAGIFWLTKRLVREEFDRKK
jgi:CheY-like chemotaxis protein